MLGKHTIAIDGNKFRKWEHSGAILDDLTVGKVLKASFVAKRHQL